MGIQVIKKNQQASGQFNNGEILENKPIGFPREGGHIKPYSNLFYWAHAWSDNGSTIGLHPHQGFEIMSFVLQDSLEHFDTKMNKWIKLEKGAVQIIRAGNGISHSEKLNPGAHMFQIWFDPNLEKSMVKPASYDDYPIEQFPKEEKEGYSQITFKGEGSPLQMDTPGVSIYQLDLNEGNHQLEMKADKYHSFYLIDGQLKIEGDQLEADDYFILSDQEKLEVESQGRAKLFYISSLKKLDYQTYTQRAQFNG